MADTMDAINHMFDQDYNEFRNSVNDILMDKLQGRVDNERIAVGQAMFADPAEEDDYVPGEEVQQQDDADLDPTPQFEEDEDISDEEV